MLVWARCVRPVLVVSGKTAISLHPGWEIEIDRTDLSRYPELIEMTDRTPTPPHGEEFIVVDEEEHP